MDDRIQSSEWMLSLLPDTVYCQASLVDVGAGCGALLLAAAAKGIRTGVGIEPFPFDCEKGIFDPAYPHLTREAFRSLAGKPARNQATLVMIDAFAEQADFLGPSFDICTVFDVMEHVADVQAVVASCYRLLRPGGFLLMSTAPLYYSPAGHHLFEVFPTDNFPWVHLWKDASAVLETASIHPYLAHHFRALNRVTSSTLRTSVEMAGFSMVFDRSYSNDRYPELYEQFKDRIDHSAIPSVEDLTVETYQILARKTQ